MDGRTIDSRLSGLDRPRGAEVRDLLLGENRLRLEGLDLDLAAALERRWGRFLRRPETESPACTARIYSAGPDDWLEPPGPCEPYRLEAFDAPPRRVVASYHFAVGADEEPRAWRIGVTDRPDEPTGRVVENAIRYLTATIAIDGGGFAMHAAGVLRGGRAFLFAGPSGAGKSTVVGLSAPATSLGDDLAVVLPGRDGWLAPALPFDNSERILAEPPRGLFPVAGIWRLHQAAETRLERPSRTMATASLLSCIAFPWALPDRKETLLRHVERCVEDGCYAHLHFTRDAGFWSLLDPDGRGGTEG